MNSFFSYYLRNTNINNMKTKVKEVKEVKPQQKYYCRYYFGLGRFSW